MVGCVITVSINVLCVIRITFTVGITFSVVLTFSGVTHVCGYLGFQKEICFVFMLGDNIHLYGS